MAGVEVTSVPSVAPQPAEFNRGADSRSSKEKVSPPERVESLVVEAEQNVQRVAEAIELTDKTISPERLADLVEKLRQAIPSTENSLQFRIDEVLDRPVVSVIDEKSGKVIRQLPSDEVVRAAHNIEYMRGVLFDDRS
jgi:flagellar protein FlaG